MGLCRQTISQTTNPLVEGGLVVLETDPQGGRCNVLRFAPEAEPLRADAANLIREMERELENSCKRLLDSLRKGLGTSRGELPMFDSQR